MSLVIQLINGLKCVLDCQRRLHSIRNMFTCTSSLKTLNLKVTMSITYITHTQHNILLRKTIGRYGCFTWLCNTFQIYESSEESILIDIDWIPHTYTLNNLYVCIVNTNCTNVVDESISKDDLREKKKKRRKLFESIKIKLKCLSFKSKKYSEWNGIFTLWIKLFSYLF